MRKFLFRIFLVIMSIQLGYSSQLNSDEYNLEHFAHLRASVAPGVKESAYFYKKNCWKDSHGNVLPFKAFYNFLESQGDRVLLELGRLVLAQDLPNEHNTKENKGEAKVNLYTPRGMFNLIVPLTAKELTNDKEVLMNFIPFNAISYRNNESIKAIYEPTETTLNPGYQIIRYIFSSRVEGVLPADKDGYPPDLSRYLKCMNPDPDNEVSAMPSLLPIENAKGRKRLIIDFSYKGDLIPCLVPHMPIGIRSEISHSGYRWESTLTNQLRLVLEIEDGKIRLISLYPLDETSLILEGWKKVK